MRKQIEGHVLLPFSRYYFVGSVLNSLVMGTVLAVDDDVEHVFFVEYEWVYI